MKKSNLIIGLFLAFAACAPKEDVAGGAKLGSQAAVLLQKDGNKTADFASPIAVSAQATEEGTQKTVASYQVQLFKENNTNLVATVALDETQVAKYNALYGTQYTLLPEKYLSYSKVLNIKAGNVLSEEGTAKLNISSELKDNTPYMFALRLNSVSGAVITPNTQLLMVTFEKVKGQIKNTLAVTRDEYLKIDNGTSDASDIGDTFTMEGLINVQKFRGPDDRGEAGISTFMGTEGKALMRFGDNGVDPDHMQANGQDIGVKFKLNQWYHIALVIDNGKTTAYVNGKKVSEFNKSGALGEFFVGRSYSGGRGIVARFSELRLWKTARTAAQIKDAMYEVSPRDSGLFAYWKMNEVKNNKIPDVSGNGRDLIMQGQAKKAGRQNIKLHDEDKGVKINEE